MWYSPRVFHPLWPSVLCWLLLWLLASGSLPAMADTWVDDRASLLPIDERRALSAELAEFAERHGAALYLVTLPQLGGSSLEAEAKRLLGERAANGNTRPQLLLLVALAERRVRLQTNPAMRALLSDAQAQEIIERDIAPAFKRQAYRQGTRLALRSGMDIVLDAAPSQRQTYGPLWMLTMAVCMACLVVAVLLWRRSGEKALVASAGMGAAATAATGSAGMGAFACVLCALAWWMQQRKRQRSAKGRSRGAQHARRTTDDHRNDDDKGGSEGGRDGGASGGW